MITLYTAATPNGRKISIALEELQLRYVVHPIDIYAAQQFTPEFTALNPNQKIPVIQDDDGPGATPGHPFVLFESGAILLYLAEREGQLLPQDPLSRYRAIQWLMFQMGGIGPMFGQRHHFARVAPSGNAYALKRFTDETHRLYKVLQGHLAGSRFLAGDEYSIADIAAYAYVARWEWHDIDWSAFPSVRRWFDEISARPAVMRGMSVPA